MKCERQVSCDGGLKIDVCSTRSSTDREDAESCGDSPKTPSFHRRDQTVIFFDWDDTIFPTYHLFSIWGCNDGLSFDDLESDRKKELAAWQDAAVEYIKSATILSDRVVILTNAETSWVDHCIDTYAPALRVLFDNEAGSLKIVYANEKLKKVNGCKLRPVLRPSAELNSVRTAERLTLSKYVAMKEEVERFYSQYPEQTWKNILSLGDMPYEHDALQELTFTRLAPKDKVERLRTKAIILPAQPSLSELTLRLRFSRIMLPHYVLFDGDIDLDLQKSEDPFRDIAEALQMPDMLNVPFSRHAWGRQAPPSEVEATETIATLANTVYKAGCIRPKKKNSEIACSKLQTATDVA